MYVLTIDQQSSRKNPDRVPKLLDCLRPVATVLPFTRTVGDEVQGLLAHPDDVLEALFAVWRLGGWSSGIGLGPVEEPLGASAPESRGPGFVAAREAVEAAKNAWFPLAMRAADTPTDAQADTPTDVAAAVRNCQAGLRLLGNLVTASSDGQWRFVTALLQDPDATQAMLATRFGVSQQAVSKSLRVSAGAGIVEGREMSRALLAQAGAEADGQPDG